MGTVQNDLQVIVENSPVIIFERRRMKVDLRFLEARN